MVAMVFSCCVSRNGKSMMVFPPLSRNADSAQNVHVSGELVTAHLAFVQQI